MDARFRREAAFGLELLEVRAARQAYPHPLLFIHGAYVGAWCWAENYMPHFAQAGFDAYAVSLRGHGASHGREALDGHSIEDYVTDVAQAVQAIGQPAVLIGHSMGGFVVQKVLERQTLPAAVLLAPVPPQGLAAASLSLALTEPGLFGEVNAMMAFGRAAPHALQRAMFANPIDTVKLADYERRCQPESQRAIWDMTLFSPVQSWRLRPSPLLYLAAEHDRLIPLQHQRTGAVLLGRELEIAAGLGHGMMLEAGWRRGADRVIEWLREIV